VKEEIVPSLRAVLERRCENVPGDEIDVERIAEDVCKYEPGDSILTRKAELTSSIREAGMSHLSPAILRARRDAINHRTERSKR
jgi:hypothetical protein